MAMATTSGRRRLLSFTLAESWRLLSYQLRGSPLFGFRYAGRYPERLLIAPTDLRTSDPTVAADVYSGRFLFAGQMVDVGEDSVFDIEPPGEEWARRLHGFGWLRHLRASDMASQPNGRSLVADWIRLANRHPAVAWETEVLSRRIISWLAQAPLILEGCDFAFYTRFIRSLTRQTRRLRRVVGAAPAGLPRLRAMIALTSAALSMSDADAFVKQASRALDAELQKQVLPDGGHVSRNPGTLIDLLVDLLPLRQAFTARGIQPSRALMAVIDRMMPMIRFFRHGDGGFARFNGMGDTQSDVVATALAYDDARGSPVLNAPHSGYQRVVAGPTLVLMDSGAPPAMPLSGSAHAGCLSFELSVGRQLVVVNCGSPSVGAPRLRRLARTTAAHSTASLNDTSSCRFLNRPGLSQRFGEVVVSGPQNVTVERGQEEGGTVILARHDGYAERYGVIHHRRLQLSATGDRLDGADLFTTPRGQPGKRTGKDAFAIRFHLHPSLEALQAEAGGPIELVFVDGEMWQFEATLDANLEDSIFFSDVHGNRPSLQIVLFGRVQQQAEVSWSFRRVGFRGRVRLPDSVRAGAAPTGLPGADSLLDDG